MTIADPIAEYTTTLARALYGPRRTRRSMIAEAREGLSDAAAAYRDGGVAPERAAELAVRDFGSVDEIAPEFQDELTARQGRWAAVMIALVFPAMLMVWSFIQSSGMMGPGTYPPKDVIVLIARIEDVMSLVTAATALVLFVATFRRSARPRLLTRAIGVTGAAGAAICGGLPVVMLVLGDRHVATFSSAMTWAYIGSGLVLTVVVWQAVRALRTAKLTPVAD